MDDPLQLPFEEPLRDPQENARQPDSASAPDSADQLFAKPAANITSSEIPASPTGEDGLRKRSLRRNLFMLLSLTLAAFVLTAWILIRVDSPFGAFSAGPREIVRAQLQALNRGDLRPAYEMLSARYRQQVSFDLWRQLVVSHWGMFHAEVVRAGEPAKSGPGVTLDIHLRGADEKGYRARFVLVRVDGRWWIDDVHWAEEPDEHLTLHT